MFLPDICDSDSDNISDGIRIYSSSAYITVSKIDTYLETESLVSSETVSTISVVIILHTN